MIVFFCSFVFFCVVVRGDARGSFLVVVVVYVRAKERCEKEREREDGKRETLLLARRLY